MYKIKLKKSAEKFLKENKKFFDKIIKILKLLEVNPRPYGLLDIVKLKGYKNIYRIKVGKIRIVYEVRDEEKRIIVHLINFRGKVYKNL